MSGTPAATTAPTVPLRGGIHVLHGVYIGGGKVGDDWKIKGPRYRSSSQLKGDKWIAKTESRLRSRRDDTASRKFNGKLEDAGEKEMDKDEFIRAMKRDIRAHGHEGMYAIERDGKVVDLLDHLHEFTVDEVIKSSMDRITSTGTDGYDPYELDEIETSRLVVESLLSSTMSESIQTRFDHDNDFFDYPGNVILMMVLEVCNASVSYDIEGAQEKFEALTLDTFQGEDISALGAEAQKQVKIMQTGYALPIRTGSKFLNKITSTSSERMNRKVYALYDDVKTMEDRYKLSDPRALSRDKDYASLGPIGLIAWSQKLHATFLADHEWPALATKLPSANYARTGQDQTKRACFECGDPDHMRPDCPKLKAKRDKGAEQSTMATDDTAPPAEKRSTRRGGGGGGSNSRDPTPLAAWKYIEPKDSTKEHPDSNQKPWKWCSKCKCKATGRQGIMQLSHFDKDHVQGFRATEKTAMMASVADPDQGVPLAPPTITTTEPNDEEEDPDGLVFTGAGM